MAADNDFSDNELDAFDSRNERVLLDQAGDYLNGNSSDDESEEEVLGLKNQNESDSNEESGSEDEEENEGNEEIEGEERWGSKKNYYGGDDVSDDDGGAEMAEEALRQQKKHLQALEMDDFVDEDMMQDWQKSAAQFDQQDSVLNHGAVVEEKTVDFDSLDEDEKLKHLQGLYPEFVPLLKEFNSLTPTLEALKLVAFEGPLVHAKYVALSAYLSSISSYFSIFVDNLKSKQKFSMKENPVMESILSTREVWRQANELSRGDEGSVAAASYKKTPVSEEYMDMDDVSEAEEEVFHEFSDDGGRIQTDSEDEDDDLQMDDASADSDADTNVNIDVTAKRTIRKPAAVASGDYTETAAPDSIDKEEKERRKKSLRFYTSKIDQAAKKNAANERFDGDLDLPYRERLFERQQRLLEEARKKGLGKDKAQLGEDLDGEDYGSGDEQLAHAINGDAEDYYESIKKSKFATKDARRAAHEQVKKAARLGKLGELAENADEHGKRALNFQILKNKGLTPNRRNDNRNARVKKRKRYDQAQKKLKSVRQVYDESNRGPYQGEKTGIKKGLSRSVRLN